MNLKLEVGNSVIMINDDIIRLDGEICKLHKSLIGAMQVSSTERVNVVSKKHAFVSDGECLIIDIQVVGYEDGEVVKYNRSLKSCDFTESEDFINQNFGMLYEDAVSAGFISTVDLGGLTPANHYAVY